MRLLEPGARLRRVRPYAPTIVVLAISLSLASYFAWMTRGDAVDRAQAAFRLEVRLARDAIVDVMRTYEQSLRAGAGLVEAAGPLTRRDWSIFVRSLALPENFPGSQGLGYVRVVPAEQIEALVAERRKDGIGSYTFRPPGQRSMYTAIVHLEPLDWRNEQALGFDMFSEPVRRAAMERARDTGDPSWSRRVTLIQETEHDLQPGTLLYMPFYTGAGRPDTVEARRERLGGWVYGVFRMRDFFNQSLRRHAPGSLGRMRIEVFDGETADGAAPLFDSFASDGQQPGSAMPPRAKFVENFPLTVAGAQWTLRASALSGAEGLVDWRRPLAVFWLGLLSSGILAAIAGVLDYSRHRYALAERQLKAEVAERKRAEEAAQLANQELIHRVKNTLAVVTAIASQTGRHATTIDEFNGAFRSRLAGLARVQDLLNPNAAHEADLASFSRGLLAPYIGTRPDALKTDGPSVKLNHNDATLLSLVLNELATNATKYGAWSVPTGRVELGWRLTDAEEAERRMVLDWQERGGPPVAAPLAQGFGSRVMRVAIERGLRGSFTIDYDAGGIRYTMTVPRSAVEVAAEEAVGETAWSTSH